ncbi:MAG: neutral zinc metallopeptidase [Alphaproteobacteria bacterium]|nr:neutral zinc metallopeptidase [Alphaproteobacteria bacterium]
MRWEGGRRSQNVEDRRGSRRVPRAASIPLGCGTLLLIGLFLVLGGDPAVVLTLLSEAQIEPSARSPGAALSPEDERMGELVSVVLADTEDVWGGLFQQAGQRYPPPTLVLFTGQVQSACGFTSAAVGPFYCPGDQKVYIDLSFYDELHRRFRAPGDFAQAYVLAHEVGHHVQNVLGTMGQVQRQQARLPEAQANELSVRLELQADCYAGVWAHHAQAQRQLLEAGDVEEGLRAAAAIGDDNIQRMSQGYVSPESFTHGSSKQRVEWFSRGMRSGAIGDCDTFR